MPTHADDASPPAPVEKHADTSKVSLKEALAGLELTEYLAAIREDGFSEAADLWELDDEDVRAVGSTVAALPRA